MAEQWQRNSQKLILFYSLYIENNKNCSAYTVHNLRTSATKHDTQMLHTDDVQNVPNKTTQHHQRINSRTDCPAVTKGSLPILPV